MNAIGVKGLGSVDNIDGGMLVILCWRLLPVLHSGLDYKRLLWPVDCSDGRPVQFSGEGWINAASKDFSSSNKNPQWYSQRHQWDQWNPKDMIVLRCLLWGGSIEKRHSDPLFLRADYVISLTVLEAKKPFILTVVWIYTTQNTPNLNISNYQDSMHTWKELQSKLVICWARSNGPPASHENGVLTVSDPSSYSQGTIVNVTHYVGDYSTLHKFRFDSRLPAALPRLCQKPLLVILSKYLVSSLSFNHTKLLNW